MNCKICSHQFNLSTRYPLCLPCCNETICKMCKEELIGQPQQRTFKCPVDYCLEENKRDDIFKINRSVEKLLKESLGIYCVQHPSELAEFYCNNHNQLMCIECFSNQHFGHPQKKINKKTLQEYHVIILQKLGIQYQRIGDLMAVLGEYQKNQMTFTANEYLNNIREAIQILMPTLKTQQEKDAIQFFKQQEEEVKEGRMLLQREEVKQQIQQIPQQVQPLTITPDSLILKKEDHSFILKCFDQVKLKLELLYRGTRDSFAARSFHQKCDNQGPTLSIIKSEHNKIFGGYASVSWTSGNNGQYKADDKAFIISITHNTKHTIYQNYDKAVYHWSSYGPRFGGGHDIYIYDNCNNNNSSYSNLGHTYSLPNGMQYQSEQARSYLAGSQKFTVTEIEVFKVINY